MLERDHVRQLDAERYAAAIRLRDYLDAPDEPLPEPEPHEIIDDTSLLDAFRARRQAQIAAAEDERAEIDRRLRRICADEDSTEEGLDAIEAELADWEVKHAILYECSARAIEIARQKMESTVNVVPFPAAPQPVTDLIKSSAAFVSGFVPPDYLVDGILQRRFCYSLTAQTGVGKTTVAMLLAAHVSIGRPLGSLDVTKGPVLYFAGENPTDIQMRWLGLTHEMKMDPSAADVHFLPGAMPLSEFAEAITAEVVRKNIQPVLVIVDTAAAYFETDDENSNTQAAQHAKRLRSLTTLPGGPCVLILCHPTKRAADDDLIPRGGGAFLAEVDGNIALQKRDTVIVASAQGKFRGSDAWTLRFELQTVRNHPILKDARGRQIPTVIAKAIDDAAAANRERAIERDADAVLRVVPAKQMSGISATDLARKLGWYVKGDPNQPAHTKVSRLLNGLKGEKLVEQARQNRWRLTAKGELELNRMDQAKAAAMVQPPIPGPRSEQDCRG